MECYDFKVFTNVLWRFMTKFAPLMFVFLCAEVSTGWIHLKVGTQVGLHIIDYLVCISTFIFLLPKSSELLLKDVKVSKFFGMLTFPCSDRVLAKSVGFLEAISLTKDNKGSLIPAPGKGQ